MIDNKLVFSDAQAITTAAASTNVIDLVSATHQLGQLSHKARLKVTIGTAFAMSGSASTVTFALLSSTTGGGTFVTSPVSVAFTTAGSVSAGSTIIDVALPAGLNRYVEMYYTPGATMTAGTVNAFIDVD